MSDSSGREKGARPAVPPGGLSSRNWQALWIFLGIAFGVPWVCWTILALDWVSGASRAGQALYMSGIACSIGGFLAASAQGGWSAVRGMLAEGLRLKAAPVWWLFALLMAPIWHLASVGLYAALYGGSFVIEATALAGLVSLTALYLFIPGPLAEEFGWRGFLLPWLLKRHNAMTSVLIVGVLWTIWHLPIFYTQAVSSPTWAMFYLVFVLCLSVLIGVVYLHTGSLLLAIVIHWSFNTAQVFSRAVFPDAPHGADAFNLVRIGLLATITLSMTPLLLRFRLAARDHLSGHADPVKRISP